MIKLYRKEKSPPADAIEAEFQDMLLGYDRLVIAEQDAKQMFGAEAGLPVMWTLTIKSASFLFRRLRRASRHAASQR